MDDGVPEQQSAEFTSWNGQSLAWLPHTLPAVKALRDTGRGLQECPAVSLLLLEDRTLNSLPSCLLFTLSPFTIRAVAWAQGLWCI